MVRHMYVTAYVSFPGDDALYQVGADVTYDHGDRCQGPYHEVGEPDVSAPDGLLSTSRLIDPDTLPRGWSNIAEEALVAAHEGAVGDMLDSAADYAYECEKDGC